MAVHRPSAMDHARPGEDGTVRPRWWSAPGRPSSRHHSPRRVSFAHVRTDGDGLEVREPRRPVNRELAHAGGRRSRVCGARNHRSGSRRRHGGRALLRRVGRAVGDGVERVEPAHACESLHRRVPLEFDVDRQRRRAGCGVCFLSSRFRCSSLAFFQQLLVSSPAVWGRRAPRTSAGLECLMRYADLLRSGRVVV